MARLTSSVPVTPAVTQDDQQSAGMSIGLQSESIAHCFTAVVAWMRMASAWEVRAWQSSLSSVDVLAETLSGGSIDDRLHAIDQRTTPKMSGVRKRSFARWFLRFMVATKNNANWSTPPQGYLRVESTNLFHGASCSLCRCLLVPRRRAWDSRKSCRRLTTRRCSSWCRCPPTYSRLTCTFRRRC